MGEVPDVVAVLISPAEVAGLTVMSLKRLVVNEATEAKTAISQIGTLPSALIRRCRCFRNISFHANSIDKTCVFRKTSYCLLLILIQHSAWLKMKKKTDLQWNAALFRQFFRCSRLVAQWFLRSNNFTCDTKRQTTSRFAKTKRVIPHGLVVRIWRFHRRGPGSTPGVGAKPIYSSWVVRCKG